jgi:hypothetical protein
MPRNLLGVHTRCFASEPFLNRRFLELADLGYPPSPCSALGTRARQACMRSQAINREDVPKKILRYRKRVITFHSVQAQAPYLHNF